VFVTDGAASPAAEPPFSAERLVRLRITEAVNATQALGVDASDLHFLGQPDAGLSTLEPNRRAALVERLAGILRSTGARELFIPHARDRHPDHEATFEIAMDALAVAGTRVRVYQYAVWMTWLNPLLVRLKLSHLRDALSLSIRPVLGKKCGAVGVYASQLAELPPGFVDAFLRPIELFFPVRESAGISRKEGVAA
jgi:LmbE family N-acetylglucosaminyl deacetylase